jgi:hypothetical protein
MAQDRLTNAVLRRLAELGLPSSLIELDEFHDRFFLRRWVMFVRDGDEVANVHLVQPQACSKQQSRHCAHTRRNRKVRRAPP